MEEVQLSMTLAEFLNEARRTGGAVMLEVPESPILGQPPALVMAVTGDDVRELQELFKKHFRLGGGNQNGSGSGIILP
ncbi:MAG: hypothetical protein ACR2GW_07120 [Pyrinomonadaceae bacterium]